MNQARSFKSLAMAATCGFAALGCYLVSLRVASERAALEGVEMQIVDAQRDLRVLQTEIGTRGRLSQLERWNASVLALSAPGADQILKGSFELARLAKPEQAPAIDAPVVLAAAPAVPKPAVPAHDDTSVAHPATPTRAVGAQLSQASYTTRLPENEQKIGTREVPAVAASKPSAAAATTKDRPATAVAPAAKRSKDAPGLAAAKPAPTKAKAETKKTVDKPAAAKTAAVTKPRQLAKADPLAPLPAASHKTVKDPAKAR